MKHAFTDDKEDSGVGLLKDPKEINNSNDVGRATTRGSTPSDKSAKKKQIIKWSIIGTIILIVVILAIVLPIVFRKKKTPDNPTPVVTDYNPYTLEDKDIVETSIDMEAVLRIGTEINDEQILENIHKLTADKNSDKLGVDAKAMPLGVNNQLTKNLRFKVGLVQQRIAHLTLTDDDNKERFQIPEDQVPKAHDSQSMRLDMLGFSYTKQPFGISFTDPLDSDNVYVKTSGKTLFFSDKYIQMDFVLPSQRIFGFGERLHNFQLSEGTWTMWASGQNSPYDDGSGRYGLYGVHPFILVQGKNKNDFFGIYFRNSNAQSPVIKFNEDGTTLLSYITTGGIIDVYFFIHGTAKEIIRSYQDQFGKPTLPPFWSLGWQQSSYKWTTQEKVQTVIDSYQTNEFPLDTIYLDIPYMDNNQDFTVDPKNFPNIKTLAENLHKNNQQLVLIIDAGISADDVSDKNKYYTQGNKDKVFIKSGQYKSEKYNDNLILKVYPEKSVFIDWFSPKCYDLWSLGLKDLCNQVPFDGLWLDMNEPTGLTHGEIKPDDAKPITEELEDLPKQPRFLLQDENINYKWYKAFSQDKESTFFLPFVPQYDRENTGNFDNQTLSLNATHSNGYIEYDVHNLYGHMMSKNTHKYLTTDPAHKDKRPFILTRSTFTSTGSYASHWLGDSFRDWKYLKYSISGIMNMNMFGIPHVGADICGFYGKDRDDELCARWTQLATFYPLARFHYDKDSDDNEPYLMEEPYKSISRRAMLDRYQYLRHLYTCLFESSQDGGSCFDPLLYYFPTDEKVYEDIESTFMVGGALKVTPILSKLEKDQKTYKAYFPKGVWVNVADPSEIFDTRKKGGDTVELDATRQSVNVHLKQGSMIAFQDNSEGDVMNTQELIDRPISLLINRDDNGYAYGSVFLDNGSSLEELNNENYEYYQLHFQSNSIQVFLDVGKRASQNKLLDQIKIFNAEDLKDNYSFACYLDQNLQPQSLSADYIKELKTLKLTPEKLMKFSDIHSIHFGGDDDVNICDTTQFAYKPVNELPDLTTTNKVAIELEPVNGKLPNIEATIRVMKGGIVNIKWTWKDQPKDKRVPAEIPEELVATKNIPDMESAKLSDYVQLTETPYFKIALFTRSGQTTYFSVEGMIFDEYLNWINTQVTTLPGEEFQGIFGLGERANEDFFYQDGVYSLWTRDINTPDEHGTLPAANMYGVHPFYMYKHKTDSWIGVYYKLAHAQDWWIKNTKETGKINIKTIATGGVADIYVMSDVNPESVLTKYFSLVGRPVLTPQWTLGWNQCRWGYKTLDEVKAVVQGYLDNKLPLDVQWTDIEYMNKYRNFEYDTHNYKGLPEYITDELHKNGMKYVPIIDAGIAARPHEKEDPYAAYNDGVKNDVFIKMNNEPFIGQVWPGDSVYPDYFKEATSEWWQTQISKLHNQIAFDGIWEDMNEASNFCNGPCYEKHRAADPVKYNLKYVPTGRDLEFKSITLDAVHSNGYLQLDAHSYYGTQMVKATHEWFEKQDKRTFILERSSMAGMGKFASRWLGDNQSTERNMAYSVSGIMLMNMFGITLSGADICGFFDDTTWQLCTKWHIVGAFYPFSRNHNALGQVSQEPWQFKDKKFNGRDVLDIMRDAIKTKYSLIRYYYSTMFDISTETTEKPPTTLYKPLFFEFPNDPKAFNDIVYNVMLGDALKLSINPASLDEQTHSFYFPAGLWCSLLSTDDTNAKVGTCFRSAGESKTYASDLSDYQVHIREGKIVPMQDVINKDFKTTKDLQKLGIDLHILGSSTSDAEISWSADAPYINDDGETLKYEKAMNYYEITASQAAAVKITVEFKQMINAQNQKYSDIEGCTAVNQNDFLDRIFFYNADRFGNNVEYAVNAYLVSDEQTPVPVGSAVYDKDSNRLIFTATNALCMSTIKQLQFTKTPQP